MHDSILDAVIHVMYSADISRVHAQSPSLEPKGPVRFCLFCLAASLHSEES